MGTAASISVKISANVSDFEKSMASLERGFAKTGASLQSVGSKLTTAISLPLTAIGGAAIKAAVDFESSFTGVAKTVDGIANSRGVLTAFGQELSQQFRQLARELPVSVNELNRIAETAGAMGIPKEVILNFTEVMAKLGATTNLTSDAAATAIGKIQNVYQSAGVDTDRFAAALVDLGNKGASTEADIVQFAQRMAGFGVQANISQAEVLGWSNAMASVGVNAELGSTAWNKVVSNIGVAVDTGGAKLQAFAQVAGMTATQFAQLWKTDASEALNRVVEGFGRIKSSGGNLSGTMADLGMKTAGIRMTFMNLASAGDMVRASLDTGKQAWQANTAMQEEFQKRAATVASQLQVLWNKLYDVGISLGQTLVPALMRMAPAVEGVLSGLASLVSWFSQLPSGVQTAAIGVAAFAAAMGPVTYVVGTVMTAGSALLTLFRMIGGASLFAPIATGAASAATSIGGFAAAAMAIPGVQIAAGIAAIGAAFVILVPQIRGAINEMGLWNTIKQGALGAALNMPVIGSLLGSPGGVSRPGRKSGGDIVLPNEVKQMADAMQHQADLQKRLIQQYPELAKAMGVAGDSTKSLKTQTKEHAVVTAEMAHANDLLAVAMGHARAEAQYAAQAEHARFAQMGKDLAAIPHNVPLLLPSRDLSGIAPTIDAPSGNHPSSTLIAKELVTPVRAAFTEFFQDLPGMVLQAVQHGGISAVVGSLAQGLGNQFSGIFGQALQGAGGDVSKLSTGTKALGLAGMGISTAIGAFQMGKQYGKAKGALGGAASGALAGTMIMPGIGTAVGAGVGALAGWIGGMTSTKGRAAVKDFVTQTFGSFDALHTKLGELGAAGEQLWVKLTQGVGRGNPQQAEAAIKAVTDALDAQKKKIEGIGEIMAGVNARSQVFGDTLKGASDAQATKLATALKAGHIGANSARGREMAAVSNIQFQAANQGEFDRMGAFAVGAFGAQVQEQGGPLAALAALKPTMDVLTQAQAQFGFTVSSTVQRLLDMQAAVTNNMPAFQALEADSQILQGALKANWADMSLFAAASTDVAAQIGKIVANGVPMSQALAMNQPVLQSLWEAQKQFGFQTDEATQALLDQAVAQGVVGPQMRDVNKQILDVLLAIGKVLGADIPQALSQLPGAAKAAADGMNGAFGGVHPPSVEPNTRGDAPDVDVPGLASGGVVRARPGGTLVRLGEGGQDEAVVPMSGRGGSRGAASSTVILEVDGRTWAEILVPHIPGVVQRYGLA